jgi:aromatic-L-amino-acid/L-tryptophan decarboxylase
MTDHRKDVAGSKPDQNSDMSAEEFRRYGYQVVDWIADYFSHPERYPVLSHVGLGQIKNDLPRSAPRLGEDMEAILTDFDKLIMPGVTHWNHPAFFAYIAVSASGPGILGEMLSAALNVNAMLWRTSPAATELEEVTMGWVRQMMGLPDEFAGVIYDTASISTLCAIAAAREAVPGLSVREDGLAGDGLASPARLRLYTSEHAHSSVEKGAITLGLGQNSVRLISSDDSFRLDPANLRRAIEEDRQAGYRPFCVVATTGTTSTGSVDPVTEIADIAEREGLWLHVDAAYGGSVAILPEMRDLFRGVDRADSLVINPHKWMFVPIDLSILFCRRLDVLRQAFSLVPEYLRTTDTDEVKNFMDYGPQLGRRFRAIKLWFVLRYFGAEGIATRIRGHLELAREFARLIDESPDFERLAPVGFGIVCFRAHPAGRSARSGNEYLERLNEKLLEEVNRTGKVYLSHTKLKGVFTLRLVVGNIRTTREHVLMAWDELSAALSRLTGEPR